MKISDFLPIPRGITAILGGGGKTTLLYKLAQELSAAGRVIVAASTRIYPPREIPTRFDASPAEIRAYFQTNRVLCLGEPAENGKLSAPKLPFSALSELADYILVEADGSRGLPLKAHEPQEPVIPEGTALRVYVVGVDAFGERIRDAAHRPALYARLAETDEQAVVTPELAARVLEREALSDVVLLNKVETAEEYVLAWQFARARKKATVVGSLQKECYQCLC